jgi:DNA-binding response OmpR family regulator
VLVIDDEAQVREVVQRMLRLDGHVAQMAATAREGLDLFSRQPFDIVVTDLGLPDLPGWEVARTIKTGCPTTPVVLVTGWWEEGDRPTDGENVDAILAKPFGIAELRQAVTAAIESIPASPEPLSS